MTKSNKNMYLITLAIQSGEYIKYSTEFYLASDTIDAKTSALLYECHNDRSPHEFRTYEDISDLLEKGIFDCHGHFHYSIYKCKKVKPEHQKIIRKYLGS